MADVGGAVGVGVADGGRGMLAVGFEISDERFWA